MSKGSAPSAPNPYTTAQAQYQYGTQAAAFGQQLNDMNTQGPTGSTTYKQTGVGSTGAPIMTQTTTLSPAEQAILSGTQGVQEGELGGAANLLSAYDKAGAAGEPSVAPVQYSAGNTGPIATSINTSGVPGIEPIEGSKGLEQQGQQTALAGEMAALQPGQSQAQEQLSAQLINSGIHPGDPAYTNAMAALNAQQGQQDTQAAGAAITAGTGLENTVYGEEANTNQQMFSEAQAQEQAQNSGQQQQFGENFQNAELGNSAGQTALADYANELGIPVNDLQAILGGSQVTSPSSISPTAQQVSAPDIMSAFQNQYAGQLAGYNANVASTNGLIGDAATIAAMAVAASDRRVKRDIARIGVTPGGLPVYSFRYVWDEPSAALRIGVMADEVEPVIPTAVFTHPLGFKMVDYAQLR